MALVSFLILAEGIESFQMLAEGIERFLLAEGLGRDQWYI